MFVGLMVKTSTDFGENDSRSPRVISALVKTRISTPSSNRLLVSDETKTITLYSDGLYNQNPPRPDFDPNPCDEDQNKTKFSEFLEKQINNSADSAMDDASHYFEKNINDNCYLPVSKLIEKFSESAKQLKERETIIGNGINKYFENETKIKKTFPKHDSNENHQFINNSLQEKEINLENDEINSNNHQECFDISFNRDAFQDSINFFKSILETKENEHNPKPTTENKLNHEKLKCVKIHSEDTNKTNLENITNFNNINSKEDESPSKKLKFEQVSFLQKEPAQETKTLKIQNDEYLSFRNTQSRSNLNDDFPHFHYTSSSEVPPKLPPKNIKKDPSSRNSSGSLANEQPPPLPPKKTKSVSFDQVLKLYDCLESDFDKLLDSSSNKFIKENVKVTSHSDKKKKSIHIIQTNLTNSHSPRMNNNSTNYIKENNNNLVNKTQTNPRYLSEMNLPANETKLFKTEKKIFFRAGVLSQLEAQRDAKLTAFFIRLQAQCRGFLSRKKLAKLKVQDVAIRCVQRNVRKYLRVREWTWYRLYIHLSPLLLACRSETKYNEEVESLRTRVNKLEQERLALKHENERLDARISELSADLADEHSAATLASERLEAECAERARLEQEIQSVQMENKALQQSTERLETELHLVRSTELNDLEAALESSGTCEDQDLGNSGTGAALYKHRYERATRELELAKKRMQQQHEADLEQLVGLKKQMDKKLADAYEEVDEQRKVVAQWKRKVLKLTSEANDVRLLLEEQNSRNNLLEKKQRKFDSELQKLNEELRQERNQKERATRERDIITTEKQQVEQMLAALKLELDLKDEVIAERSKELDEMTFGGKSEEDFSLIKKQKADLEKKLEEQEDELDDLAGQVQLLEQAKIRLEMCLEQQRKEHRREMQQRDDELEEARSSSIKKLKALEMQLETEHEHKTNLLRARHELERRYQLAEERNKTIISKFEDTTAKLKRDLIRTKALLKDTQAALEQSRGENNPARVRLRSLKIQMEDLEIARDSALKSKQSLERDLLDTQSTLDECINARRDAEERGTAMARDLAEVKSQLDENEDELAEILKKYKTAVNQLSSEQKHVHEQIQLVSELESERQSLKDQIHELQTKLDHAMNMLRSSSVGSVASASGGPGSTPVEGTRQDMKIRELESKLDLEKTTRSRLEVQITRLKESLEKTTKESTQAKTKEQQAQIELRRIQASIRTLNEQQASLKSKDNEFSIKLRDSERRAKIAETEAAAARRETEEMRARLESLTEALEKDVNESTDSNEEDSELSNIDDDEDEENHSQQRNFETSMESFRPGESSI